MFRMGGSSSKKSSDNRRFPRFSSDKIRFEMDGRELHVIDISATGIQVRGAPNWIATGQALIFNLLVPVRGQTLPVAASGRVIRKLGDGLAIHYQSPHPNWKRLLTDYLARR